MKVFKKIIIFFFGLIFIGILCGLIYFFSVTKSVKLDCERLYSPTAIVSVYDKNDEFAFECTNSGKTFVKFGSIPSHTVNALLCAEDKEFFNHKGLNYKRMLIATFKNIKSKSFKEGASTISQQLIKNTHLTDEKTIARKLKEIRPTKKLERKFSKDEILEAYLNTIYFGHSCFGIEEAAEFYFNKKVSELNISESAILAGLIKSPNNYSPFKNAEKCKNRRDFVLNTMKNEGYISKNELENAKNSPLPTQKTVDKGNNYSYKVALFDELESIFGDKIPPKLKIYTYLDKEKQDFLTNIAIKEDRDVSLTILNNENCGVEAFVSDIGLSKRLPGSTIKPLAVFAPALEEDVISPASPLIDEKTQYGEYIPKNFDGKYHGVVTARDALSKSYNVATIRLFNALGIENGVKYLKRLGIQIENDEKSLVLALGGMKKGVNALELSSAYSTFARQGKYENCKFISRIETQDGKTAYKRKYNETNVFSEETTSLINDILHEATKTGTAKKLRSLPFDVCAKTGTAGIDEGNTDAWCVAYDRNNTICVWTGKKDGSLMDDLGGGFPTDTVFKIYKKIEGKTPPVLPKISKNIVMYKIDKNEFYANNKLVIASENAPRSSYFTDIFKISNAPKKIKSTTSRQDRINPQIKVENNGIKLILCQTQYNSIIVYRANNGKLLKVYSGIMKEYIIDKEVIEGERYTYFITPFGGKKVGKTQILPSVEYKKGSL